MTLTSVRRNAEDREWWQGWWESTVCWLEVGEDGNSLVTREATFYSDVERTAGIQERIDLGVLYDVLWMTETILGGKGLLGVPVYSAEEWEKMMGTSLPASEENILVV